MLIEKRREKGQTFTLCLTEPSETACQLMKIYESHLRSPLGNLQSLGCQGFNSCSFNQNNLKNVVKVAYLHPFGGRPRGFFPFRLQQNSES